MSAVSKKFIQDKIQKDDFRMTTHVTQRRLERGISLKEIKKILIEGELIEVQNDAKPYPKGLVLGFTKEGDPIHVLVSRGNIAPYLRIITVYEPDECFWDRTFKNRKK